jgi:hypothetical protein
LTSIDDDLISEIRGFSSVTGSKRPHEIQYKDTSQCWEALKNGNYLEKEPEVVAFSSGNIDYYDVVSSERSTPTHCIPYVVDEKVDTFWDIIF